MDKELLVFITVTIVDPAGNRIHPNEDSPADYYDDMPDFYRPFTQ